MILRGLLALALLSACGDETLNLDDAPGFSVTPFWEGVPDTGAALVVNNYTDTVSVIDLDTATHVGDLPVGLNPVEREGPHHVAVSWDGAFAYVGISNFVPGSGSGPHGSHGTGSARGHALQIDTNRLSVSRSTRIDRSPGDMTVISNDGPVAFTHFDALRIDEALQSGEGIEATRATLMLLDMNLDPIETVQVCAMPHGVRANADGARLYVACWGSDEVAEVDLNSFAVGRVPVADDVAPPPAARYFPNSVHVSRADGRVWVTLAGANELRVYDPDAGAMDPACEPDVGGPPYFGMFLEGGATFVVPVQSAPSALAWIDTATCEETGRLVLESEDCDRAHMIILGREGEDGPMYLVCEGNRVDPGTFVVLSGAHPEASVEDVIPVGLFPDGAALLYPGLGINPP